MSTSVHFRCILCTHPEFSESETTGAKVDRGHIRSITVCYLFLYYYHLEQGKNTMTKALRINARQSSRQIAKPNTETIANRCLFSQLQKQQIKSFSSQTLAIQLPNSAASILVLVPVARTGGMKVCSILAHQHLRIKESHSITMLTSRNLQHWQCI